MTIKLFNNILATCLLFSSLYLSAQAETANKVPTEKPSTQLKKSPETNFLDGDACLKQANTACAKLALANIPSTSAYAKLLQGSIALTEKQTDKALLLLLPLQTEENLIAEAKIALHQSLASAFESLDDAQQAIGHLVQAEATTSTSKVKDAQTAIAAIHDQIWAMLNKLGQAELIELRGNNTDNIFQGWIDLCLAAKNQDLNSSLAGWGAIYPDHPAQTFAKNLTVSKVAQPISQASLTSEGSIALIMPLTTEAYAAKADAFRLGLETALTKYGLHNEIRTYPSSENQQDINEMCTLAKNEGNAYFITPSFNANGAGSRIEQADTNSILHISSILDDEARHIVNFALSRGMQKITIITTDNDTSKSMTTSFQAAWQGRAGHEPERDSISIITLPGNISSADSRLLELKLQLAEKMHDMLLLAMPGAEARLVRPHLPISTPTMTFSNANEMLNEEEAQYALNAVRLFDIPYLLIADQAPYNDYEAAIDASLSTNERLRWFALGVDSLQLLMATQKLPDREVSINGLTGTLSVDNAGNIKRQLSLARFTLNGIAPEQ